MQSKILLTTLLASAASANMNFMAHPNMKRELEARATATSGALSEECASALQEVYTDIPTPPAAIISDILSQTQTDPCKFTTPASLSKQYSSYSEEVVSWYDDHSDDIESIYSECPALSAYATGSVDACETGSSGSSSDDSDSDSNTSDAAATASATGTSGADSASSTKSSTDSTATGGASRQSGMAIAAVAVAGFVVALL
ncbi:hypothetical protein G7Z17_g5574 [Cylindrodendrum hubeiense]|uniref:DUF7735 domain-containing protein n=1 Tax=Cylindrodendrum hubeiense TaxID=595255 RepID=A0A9P5LG10_9HYPO|nr:hypothetical protein G7Z17_g5574 [Cylindrodendrum hubeiense]